MVTTKLDQFQEMEWFAGRVRDWSHVFSKHACGEKYLDTEVEHRMNALIAAQDFTASEQIAVIEYP